MTPVKPTFDDAGNVTNRDELIESAMGLVSYIQARYFRRTLYNETLTDDLHSIGYLAICKAYQRWNPHSCVLFSTFTFKGIKWDMIRYLQYQPKHTPLTEKWGKSLRRDGESGRKSHSTFETYDIPQPETNKRGDLDEWASLIPKLLEALPTQERRLLELRLEGKTTREIYKTKGLCVNSRKYMQLHTNIQTKARELANV